MTNLVRATPVVEGEFIESDAQQFPKPPLGYAYLVTENKVALCRVTTLEVEPEREFEADYGESGHRFRRESPLCWTIEFRGIARKIVDR